MMEISVGIITFSLTTVISFIVWLLKRRKDFKKILKMIKGDDVEKNKKTFKLKYAFYKKLIKLLMKSIKDKYLHDVFQNGDIDYEKIVKEVLDFIKSDDGKTGVVP